MPPRNLDEALAAADGPVDLLRAVTRPPHPFPAVPPEYTNWIDEQRAWREACALADQSHHMTDLWVEGPDAFDLFASLGVNDFESFDVGRAKQFIACNPNGYVIGDGILFRLDEDRFQLVGEAPGVNWVQYNAETGGFDARFSRDDDSGVRDGPPRQFRYQIQGPNAIDVMAEASDEGLPDLPFFGFGEIRIDGRPAHALRHGMAGEAGFEFWGPWEHGEAIRDRVMDVGDEFGIRRLGWQSYGTCGIMAGWWGNPLPAIYDAPELSAYRRWLSADCHEARFLLGGSFETDDVTDYYVTPHALGYDHLVSYDGDFVGRDALAGMADAETRTKVTLVWDDEDVVDVFASLFRAGTTGKHMRLPMPAWSNQFDEVRHEEEPVGVSVYPVYVYNERSMLSLGVIDAERADPGNRVSLVWGEEGSSNIRVERHEDREIGATVAPVPYTEDNR